MKRQVQVQVSALRLPFLKPTKLVFTAFIFLAFISAITAETVAVAEFVKPDGTLNSQAIGGRQLSLDIKGWQVTLDPLRGPVFTPPPSVWSSLGTGLTGAVVNAIVVNGSDVYVGGIFTTVGTGGTAVTGLNNVAKWNGTAWSALGSGLNGVVYAMAISGSDIYVGGGFTDVGSGGTSVTGLNGIARWNGTAWFALDRGLAGFATVAAIAVSGSDVYVGGSFTTVGSGGASVTGLNRIARWNSITGTWSPLGAGLNKDVQSIAISGSNIFVGGRFTDVGSGGTTVANLNYIARWNGTAWSALGRGLDSWVYTIAVRGTDVFVGGSFTGVGGGTAVAGLNRIARWNGSSWSALGSGLSWTVLSLAVSGSNLYVGGSFSDVGSGGTSVTGLNGIALWNGSSWSSLDNGLNDRVTALGVGGNDVYAGGGFTNNKAGTATNLNYIARWGAPACTPVAPSITITANPTGSITSGTSVTFTATPTNGGSTPAYQWKKNGNNAGNNSTTYTDAALANGDKITCVLTSSDACASPTTATSNEITMIVTPACACDPTCSPIPTAANTYTATQAVLNATSGYTHYCDASNNLLLSLKVPSGMTIPAAAVKIKVGATAATFYARFCGAATASNACFMDRVGGSVLINRFWHIDQTLVTGGTVSATNQLSVASYFMESEYTALNTALTNNAQAALTNKTQLRLYQPRGSLNFGAFADPTAIVPQFSVGRHSHGTTPSTSTWLLSTPQPTINMAEFRLSSIRNGGGIGLH